MPKVLLVAVVPQAVPVQMLAAHRAELPVVAAQQAAAQMRALRVARLAAEVPRAVLMQMLAARRAELPVVAVQQAAAQMRVPKVARLVEADLKAAAPTRMRAAQLVAVDRRAVAQQAAGPRAGRQALWVAAPQVVLAAIRRQGAEPLAVAPTVRRVAAAAVA